MGLLGTNYPSLSQIPNTRSQRRLSIPFRDPYRLIGLEKKVQADGREDAEKTLFASPCLRLSCLSSDAKTQKNRYPAPVWCTGTVRLHQPVFATRRA